MDEQQTTAEGHHRSARERQRRGPMWGCLRWIIIGAIAFAALFILIIGGGWLYLGTGSFADLVALRIASTLESRLGRKVTIGSVVIDRAHLTKVVINDLRIANSPGAVHPYFATVKQVTINGGVNSFWGRRISVDRVDITQPQMFFEIYPAGSQLVHNFPQWNSGPPSRYEIVRMDIHQLFIENGGFDFLDRRHNVAADSNHISAVVNVTSNKNLYAGTGSSPLFRMRIQDYMPVDMTMRAQFRYTPGVLELQSVALDGGPDLRVFLSGRFDPLTQGAYNLHVASAIGLNRVRDVFRVQRPLSGMMSMDALLRGKAGTFTLAGGWVSADIKADAYELTNARGKLNITGDRAIIDVDRATFDGGGLTAHYILPKYAEPYPMSVDARFNGLSIERLFANWGVKDTGLDGSATGTLAYHWNKDKILEGAGSGTATLVKTTAFSGAKYPIPVAGATDFALDNGVVTFRRANLQTDTSTIDLNGTLRIADLSTNLQAKIHSGDFSELDRIGYNFAHSAGKTKYTLLGLGGSGDITGAIRGPLKTADVVAHVIGSGTKYNNVVLGSADIDLHYDGIHDTLQFNRAVFEEAGGRLTLTGTIKFPAKGPSPVFDLVADAQNYPIDRAVATVNLKLAVSGLGTGRVTVTGSPEEGKVTFAPLVVNRGNGETLRVEGSTQWLPGSGNVVFDLAINAQSFPVADIVKFLDLGTFPVTGQLTGSLNIRGPKKELEGAGTVTVRNGSIYGEPVTTATANVQFTKGTLKLTNLSAQGPSGTISGQAELNLQTNQFNYSIQSSSIDLSRINALSSLAGLLGGNLTIQSTGAGTFNQPELVATATLNQATLKGLNLPPGSPPPTIYIAIRNGQLVVKGSVADLATIDGTGSIATDGTLSGSVQIKVPDLAKLASISPNTASIPVSGGLTTNLQLGGKISSLEAIRIDATFPQFDVRVSEHEFQPVRPLHIALRNGQIVFDDFNLSLVGTASTFAVTGFAELVGQKRLSLDIHGLLEAALLALFMKDVRADGHIIIAAGVHGTMSAPTVTGTAEFEEAQVRFGGFPQLIDHITGRLVFRGDRVDIENLRANVGGGTVAAGGTVTLAGIMPQRVRITLQGTDVSIRYFEGLTVEGTFTLQLAGDMQRMTLTGDIAVARGVYYKEIDLGNMILGVILSRRGVTPVTSAAWQDRVSLRVHLSAPDTLAVRNNIADLTGSGDIDVTGTLANPVILGNVTLDEGGKVRFQNIDYTLTHGTLNFQNPFRIDPYFDITLEARVTGGISEIESGPIDVTLNVTGTVDRITPTITSDPPTSDITLFSLLGLGGVTNRTGTTTTDTAGLAGRSLLYQSAARLLASRVLPFVDAFSYDPGLLDTTGDPGPKVSFEKRLSNNFTLFVVYNTQDHKKRFVVEWQVNPEWILQFTRDEMVSEYRAEARYRRRYEGHWTWGGRGKNTMATFAKFGETPSAPPPPPPATNEPVAPPAGSPVVNAINFTADSNFDTTVLRNYVTQRTGQPLSLRDVQDSIKSLFSTGDFRDVRVSDTPSANGVELTFALFVNYRVGAINFDGLGSADRDRATRELTFRLGDVVSLNAIDRSAVAIQNFLNRSGYLESTVDPETVFNRAQSRATVTFHATRGPRATVGQVVLEGNTAPFSPAELIAQMRHGPAKTFEVAEARSDADRMRQFLLHRDYRKADIRFLNSTYDKETHQVTLRYRANTGPIVKVQVTGVSAHDVRGLIPFRRNQPYSEDAIDRASEDIIKDYQSRGYFSAAVDTEEHLTDGVWMITFHVNPGARYRLTNVTFSGNHKVTDKDLAGVVTTSVSGGIRSLFATLLRRPNGVTKAQLSADRDAIESYYRLHGFSDVQVATPVATTKADGTMTVSFPIVEGPQTILTAVNVEGNQQVPAHKLPKLELKAGDPLNPQAERADIVALQAYYGDRGNVEVQIKPREEISSDKTSAKLTYVIAEGPEVKVNEVVVRGNTYTSSNVVTKSADIDRGDPFSYTSILEAQRNLYRLGIFNRVDVQGEEVGTSVADRNVVISVEEGKDLTATASAGFTSGLVQSLSHISLLGSLSAAHRNLFGTGRYVGIELVGSQDRSRQDAILTYREPFVGPWQVPVDVSVFQTNDIRRGSRIRQRGMFIEMSKVAREQTRWSIRYDYILSACLSGPVCDQIENSLVPGLDRSIANIKKASVTPSFFWDNRDDPFNPHRGSFASASVAYAFRAFAADANFMKEFAQGSWYFPVSSRSVVAVSGRVGLIQDIGRHTNEEGQVISGVPLSERFTAGGESSHRGFPLDLLGTVCLDPADLTCKPTLIFIPKNGTVAPVGGLGVFITNAEYRFPIFGSLGGAVFVDVGNTFADSTIRFNDLRYGYGTGLRYLSPVGPLRFDIGFPTSRRMIGIDEKTGKAIFEKPFAYFITLGYAF